METQVYNTTMTASSPYFNFPLKDTFQLNKRTFISTTKSRASTQQTRSLDKSKIKSLPHHTQFKMGGHNTNFVIVFQAIEIERLSDQIQTTRKRLKDYERQLCNADNYQVQIKQLSDQCLQMEAEINEYREELQKMNTICEKIYHENEKLRQKNQKIKGQQDRIKHLKTNLQKQEFEINQLRASKYNLNENNMMLTGGRSPLKKPSKVSFSQNMSQQQKIQKLSEQIMRLSQVIVNKNSEIMNLQEEVVKLRSHQPPDNQRRKSSLLNTNSTNNIGLNQLTKQLQIVQTQLIQKSEECGMLKSKQQQMLYDLQQINNLRIICERQQQFIKDKIKQLKDIDGLKINNEEMKAMLAEQRAENYELMRRLQQQRNFRQSACLSYSPITRLVSSNSDHNTQSMKAHQLLQKIQQLQTTVKQLKNNYARLLRRASQCNCNHNDSNSSPIISINSSNRGLPIIVGQSRVED